MLRREFCLSGLLSWLIGSVAPMSEQLWPPSNIEWVKVSDRLPKLHSEDTIDGEPESDRLLVLSGGHFFIAWLHNWNGKLVWTGEKSSWVIENVTHWAASDTIPRSEGERWMFC